MKSVVIIGAGGFGREVLEIFKEQNAGQEVWRILGFVDENKELCGKVVNGYPVLGSIDWLREHNRDDLGCVCAIGSCEDRKRVVERLQDVRIAFQTAIHPSVIMSRSVEVGRDVIICAGSILTVDIEIGDHVHIDTNCTVAHDVIIGSYSRLGPGVRLSGADRLGEGVYVGTGATLVNQISIGNWSTVGAGAVVLESLPEYVVAAGVPAKIIRHKQPS